jgi:carbon-monoxide dehydrogenase small subunit
MRMMAQVAMNVNGERVEGNTAPRTSLADFLRGSLGLTGTHLGCEHGVCGACTILVDDRPVRSCLMYAVQADEREIRTIEGFATDNVMAALRAAFSREHAIQCGFCTPGMLITARDIVLRLDDPGEQRVREELAGNLCRCTGYVGIVRAIRSVGAEFARGDRRTEAAIQPRHDVEPLAVSPGVGEGRLPLVPTLGGAGTVALGAASGQGSAPSKTRPPGVVEVREDIVLAQDVAAVWGFLGDVRAVAECLPGAQVTDATGDGLTGVVRIKIGPIKALFSGQATYRRDDLARSGTLSGQGQDSLSGSRVSADLDYRVAPEGDGTRVSVTLAYTLTGPLAQFSRASIAEEFVKRMLRDFTETMSRRLQGDAEAAGGSSSTSLNLGRLMLSLAMTKIRQLLRRNTRS